MTVRQPRRSSTRRTQPKLTIEWRTCLHQMIFPLTSHSMIKLRQYQSLLMKFWVGQLCDWQSIESKNLLSLCFVVWAYETVRRAPKTMNQNKGSAFEKLTQQIFQEILNQDLVRNV